MTYVTPEFFTALRIPLLQGRVFSGADAPDSASVAIVNQAFVKRYLKNGEPLGRRSRSKATPVRHRRHCGRCSWTSRAGWGRLSARSRRIPMVYTPATQFEVDWSVHIWFSPNWVVRSSLDGAQVVKAIEDATRAADPLLPMAAFQSVRDLKTDALTFQRFLAVLAGTIAAWRWCFRRWEFMGSFQTWLRSGRRSSGSGWLWDRESAGRFGSLYGRD